jgi:uncharacterized protein YacL
MIQGIIKFLFALICGYGGFSLSFWGVSFWAQGPPSIKWIIIGIVSFIFVIVGLLIAPTLINLATKTTRWLENKLNKTPMQEIIGGALGLIIGLIIANLFGISIYRLPFVGPYLFITISLLISYLGWSVGSKKRDEFVGYFASMRIGNKEKSKHESKQEIKPLYKVLDTSVIIDGRIADICRTGIIEGVLIVPGFILDELRHIADSSDLLKRNRGRRGLDILNKMQKELDVLVKVFEKDYDDVAEVDSKLVRLTKELGGKILTNDYNLNKVAEFQGVKVLNINELANAIKPVLLPGEEMVLQVIKDGKENGQGIGYLDDGTMIVVENGRNYINKIVTVVVTSVLQTAAGRMIFAKLKAGEKIIDGKSIDNKNLQSMEVEAGA